MLGIFCAGALGLGSGCASTQNNDISTRDYLRREMDTRTAGKGLHEVASSVVYIGDGLIRPIYGNGISKLTPEDESSPYHIPRRTYEGDGILNRGGYSAVTPFSSAFEVLGGASRIFTGSVKTLTGGLMQVTKKIPGLNYCVAGLNVVLNSDKRDFSTGLSNLGANVEEKVGAIKVENSAREIRKSNLEKMNSGQKILEYIPAVDELNGSEKTGEKTSFTINFLNFLAEIAEIVSKGLIRTPSSSDSGVGGAGGVGNGGGWGAGGIGGIK